MKNLNKENFLNNSIDNNGITGSQGAGPKEKKIFGPLPKEKKIISYIFLFLELCFPISKFRPLPFELA